jgi:hypothetical protein
MQVLLPSHRRETYQLWLPGWGLVLQEWNKSESSVLQSLKRSYYKERSVQALQQMLRSSPVSAELVIAWLAWQGDVLLVERPSGKFVKLA